MNTKQKFQVLRNGIAEVAMIKHISSLQPILMMLQVVNGNLDLHQVYL